jgi:hypothetical protein
MNDGRRVNQRPIGFRKMFQSELWPNIATNGQMMILAQKKKMAREEEAES